MFQPHDRQFLPVRVTAALLLASAFAVRVCAAEPPANRPETEGWIAQLASDDWKSRQRATDRLIELGDEALPRLSEVVARAPDPEVRTRAQSAIRQIEE